VECGPACGPSRPALRRRLGDGPPRAGRRWRDSSPTRRRAMNRFRMMVVSSFTGLGLLGLGASSGRAQRPYMGGTVLAPAAVGAASVYQPRASVPAAAPTAFVPRYSPPVRAYRAPAPRVHVRTYDPTGRHDNLPRPWLPSW